MHKLELRIDHSSFFDESEVVDLDEPSYKMAADDLQAMVPTESTESTALVLAESTESAALVSAAESAAVVPAHDLGARVGQLPERAQRSVRGSRVELGSRKSYQAQKARCGSQIKVLVAKRAFRLSHSCEGCMDGKKMQWRWGDDPSAAWAAATAEVCSRGSAVWA